jgi:hypothetical protein
MSGRIDPSAEFLDLVDGFCSGVIDELGFDRLEAILLASRGARHDFAAYFHHHAMIHIAFRAYRATRTARKQNNDLNEG